ncbi:hypothetical protein PSM_A1843 [Pseudoalteromonas sp. SM9913]|nr:hypothetical protein PSM_A1843 [Pseudoalteromonas sp. SM9913]
MCFLLRTLSFLTLLSQTVFGFLFIVEFVSCLFEFFINDYCSGNR